MPDVRVGDELIRFPDSMTDEEITAALRRLYPPADQPTLPVIPEPEPEVPVFEGRPILEDRVEQEIQRRVDEAIATRIGELETPEQVAAERMRQEAAIRPEVERSLRVVSRPGVGVTTAPKTTLPFFRPSRIVVTPTGERLYQDPETGDLSVPTPGQELMESFAQQQIMSPQEAQRLVGRGEAPLGILEQVSPGEGIVEAPLGAALRSVPGYLVNILGETYYRGLGYEVKPEAAQEAAALRDQARQAEEAGNTEGAEILRQQASDILIANPMDESDLGYKIAYARDWWGLPPVISDKDDLVGVLLPGVATTSTTRSAYSLDPQGRRQASDVEVPSIFEDPAGFFQAETTRIARNVAAGRTIADERRDAPDLAEYYTEAWGDPDMAYVQGMIGEVFLPIGPGLAAKGALQAARAAPGAARLAGKASKAGATELIRLSTGDPNMLEGAIRTAQYVPAQLRQSRAGQEVLRLSNDVAQGAKNIARANTPLELRVALNAHMADAARFAEATGDFVERGYALVKPGAASDALVIRKVAEKVMRAADLPAPTIARAMDNIRPNVASWSEAAGDIRLAIGEEVGQEVADAIARGLKIHVPDDFVMVTDDLAVPRAQAAEIRKGADNYVRQQISRSDDEKSVYLDLISFRLDEVDPAAATRLRAQGDLYLSGKGNEKATLNLLREAEQKLAEPGLVRDFRQKRLDELPDVVRETIDLNKYPYFADLPVGGKRRVVEGLKEYWISQNARGVARGRFDLTSMQIGLDKAKRDLTNLLDYRWLNRPFTRRLAALFGGKLDDVTKFSADAALLLRRAGRGRGRAVARALKEASAEITELAKTDGALAKQVEQYGTVSLALDEVVERQARAAKIASDEMWDEVFTAMFDPRLSREKLIQEIDLAIPGLRSSYPTTRTIDAVARFAEARPDLRWSGKVSPFGRDAQNVMLSVLLDGKIKEALAKGVVARDLQRRVSFVPYVQWGVRNQDPRSIVDIFFDPRVQEEIARDSDRYGTMFRTGRPLGRSRMIAGTDTEYEEVIARGGAEFYELLNYAPPKYRGSLLEMAKSAGEYLLGEGQLGVRQSAKYGYFLPNLPFLVWRGLEMPFIAATQTGVGTALSGMGRIGRDAARQVLRRNLTGEGITSPTGVYYSPADLVKLAEQEGIGYTAVEAERIGGLVNDIMADLNRVYGRTGRRFMDSINPATKGFWVRTAEAMERSFRQGVFEARLAAGDTVTEAAAVARRSQFDYDEVPGFLREGVLPQIYQGVSTTYKLQQEMALAALKNPRALSTYLRALDKMQEAQDPYGLEGDRSLLNLKVSVQGNDYYVRVPGAGIAETAVIAARHGDNLVTAMRNAREALKADPSKALAEIGITGGLPIAYTVVDSAIEGVLKDWETFEGADPYPTSGRDAEISDEKMFWAALLYFQDKDPTHTDGGWATFQYLFDPIPKPPPAGRAHPDMPQYWLTRPEGMPYVFVGRDAEGRAMFKAYEMGDRGKRNVAILRTVDQLELRKYFPTFVAAGIGNETFSTEGPIRAVYAGEYVDETGVQEAMNLFLNPVDVDYSQPEQEIRRQAEELLRARNPLNETPE